MAEEQIRIVISSGSDREQRGTRTSVGDGIWSLISAQLTEDIKEGIEQVAPEQQKKAPQKEDPEAAEAPPPQCGEHTQRPRNGFGLRYAILTQDDVPDPRYPFGLNPENSVRNASYRTGGGGFGMQTAVNRTSLYRTSAATECGDGTGGVRDRRMPTPPMGDPGLSSVRYTIRPR